MQQPQERYLNDYESMLATSTCNVACQCLLPVATEMEQKIRQAWMLTVEQRACLQVQIQKSDQIGVLGPRYLAQIVKSGHPERHVEILHTEMAQDLTKGLVILGTTTDSTSTNPFHHKLQIIISKRISVQSKAPLDKSKVAVSFFLRLSHALSDGPGSLQLMHHFLTNLQAQYDEGEQRDVIYFSDLIDLQAKVLGDAYGSKKESRDCYAGLLDYRNALGGDSPWQALPPEAQQGLPSAAPLPAPTEIRTYSFAMSVEDTAQLRSTCRKFGGTIQGAIDVVGLLTRIFVLSEMRQTDKDLRLPLLCALQVPVNTRSTAHVGKAECVCGSAAVWHTLLLETDSRVSNLIREASQKVQEGLHQNQHTEWLRRLMNDPASLPPYSLMMTSVGVAPWNDRYGDIELIEGAFFGGAFNSDKPPSSAQATMIHATTCGGRLRVNFNFTFPGVSPVFALKTIARLQFSLEDLARGGWDVDMTVSRVLGHGYNCKSLSVR